MKLTERKLFRFAPKGEKSSRLTALTVTPYSFIVVSIAHRCFFAFDVHVVRRSAPRADEGRLVKWGCAIDWTDW
jgi:hypothetical protein